MNNYGEKKKKHVSLPQKLHQRQIYGNKKPPGCFKPIRYFEKCPENFQIPLTRILDFEIFKKGHVSIGFSCDGKYLLSYQCQVKFQLESEPVRYKYSLHWWLFDLWQPLKKVREVELFANERIHYELHLLFCEPPNSNYVVVHGSPYSFDTQSNGKMSYASIVPSVEAVTLNHALHLRYELLPPHPPFVTSVCLKLCNAILLNSGDMLFAILLNDNKLFNQSITDFPGAGACYCRKFRTFSTCESSVHKSIGSDISRVLDVNPDNQQMQCSSNESSSSSSTDQCMQELNRPGTSQQNFKPVSNINVNDVLLTADAFNESEFSQSHILNNDSNDGSCSSRRNTEYVSYVMQGYCLPDEEESQESLPASPFDCTVTVMPSRITSSDAKDVLKQTYEHRCFRTSDKGNKDGCDFFICQAQFDSENFVNEEIQLCEDISRRYVSLRDYDMQIVDVCQETNEVVILINALVVLRDKVQRSEQKMKTPHMCEKCYKLVLYTLGYVVAWNIYTGQVTVLRKYPLVEGPGTICKTRQFSPSLSETVQLRKNWFVPTSKSASVQTLSNHTIFSGRSLQYLFNPVLPVAVVKKK